MKRIYKLFLVTLFLFHLSDVTIADNNDLSIKISKRKAKNIDPSSPTAREQETNDNKNPKPIGTTGHEQTEPAVSKEYIEKWVIISARTTDDGTLDKEFLLSPASYFKFVTGKKVFVKLNEFFPEQEGVFVQSPLIITIKLNKNPDCTNCIEKMTISRKTDQDKEFLLEFNGYRQLFTMLKN